MAFADPDRRRAYAREHYLRNRQAYIDGAKRRQDTKRWRAKRKAAGLKVNGGVWKRLAENVDRAAKRGREYWPAGCRVKPTEEVRVKPPRRPWHDPALSKAERWKMRYAMDPEFQAREYLKALKYKRARREMIAESGLPQWRVALLRIQSHRCAYCSDHMPSVTDRVIDHVIPISKGGAHEWDNLAVVCKACNQTKAARDPTVRQVEAARRQRGAMSGQLPLLPLEKV